MDSGLRSDKGKSSEELCVMLSRSAAGGAVVMRDMLYEGRRLSSLYLVGGADG
jgi:hypothetical protein